MSGQAGGCRAQSIGQHKGARELHRSRASSSRTEHLPRCVVEHALSKPTPGNTREGIYGPRNSVMAVGCTDSGHHPVSPVLALTRPGGVIMDRAAVANDPGFSAVRETSGAVASISAVAWSAVIAGAVVATATSLVLFALASGLGLASVSPWPGSGASLTAVSVGTGIGLNVVQWIAASIGGYITGRLRTRWV